MRKLFKGGNYSRAETIRGNTVFEKSYKNKSSVTKIDDLTKWVDIDAMILEILNHYNLFLLNSTSRQLHHTDFLAAISIIDSN